MTEVHRSVPSPLLDKGEYLHITFQNPEESFLQAEEFVSEKEHINERLRENLQAMQDKIIHDLESCGQWMEADKLRNCGSKAVVCKCGACEQGVGHLISCSSRFCVFCNRRRVARFRERYEVVEEHMATPLFLTLTQVSAEDETLEGSRERLMEAWTRLRRSFWWKESVIGGLYAIEATEKTVAGRSCWHCHLHAIVDISLDTGKDIISVFPHEYTDSEREGWKWSEKAGRYIEPEPLYIDRLEKHLAELDGMLEEIRSLSRRAGRTKDLLKKEELLAQRELLRIGYLSKATINALWYRATRAIAEEREVGRGAYICWLTGVDEGSFLELIKYACKPATLSLDGLYEAVATLSGSHKRLVSTFGKLYGLDSVEKELACCPHCQTQGTLQQVGSIDRLCRDIEYHVDAARLATVDEVCQSHWEQAEDFASIVIGAVRYGLGDDLSDLDTACGWGLQYLRLKERVVWWPEPLYQLSGAGCLYGDYNEEKDSS